MWQWTIHFHWKHLKWQWIIQEWMWRRNHQNRILLITSTMSNRVKSKGFCSHPPEQNSLSSQNSQRCLLAFTHSSRSHCGLLHPVSLWTETPQVAGLQPPSGAARLETSACVAEPAVEVELAPHRSALWAKKEAAGDRTWSPLSEAPEVGRNTWIHRTTDTQTGRRR